MYLPSSRYERWFFWTIVVQAVAVLVLEMWVLQPSKNTEYLSNVDGHPHILFPCLMRQSSYNLSQWESWIRPTASQVAVSYLVPINLSLIMFAVFYELLLSVKLMHDKSNILLLAICASKACIFAYSIMQYVSMRENIISIRGNRDSFNQPLVDLSRDLWKEIRPAEMMVPIIVGAATLIVCPVAYQLHKEYSWAIYQCVHGDPRTRSMYRGYEVHTLRFQELGERKLMAI